MAVKIHRDEIGELDEAGINLAESARVWRWHVDDDIALPELVVLVLLVLEPLLRVAEGAKIRTKPPRVGVLPLGCGCFYACQFLTGSGKLLLLHLLQTYLDRIHHL